MSQLIESGFKLEYTISKMRSIKITQSGNMNGNAYGASVKVKAINIIQEDDKDLGLMEKENIMEFKIPCDDKNLKKFNIFLRTLQKANKPLALSGTLPRDAGKDSYTVTSYATAEEIMANHLSNKK